MGNSILDLRLHHPSAHQSTSSLKLINGGSKHTETKFNLTIVFFLEKFYSFPISFTSTTVGTLIVVTIYLQLIQNRYMFRNFTVLQCSHQHCVQPVASDVEVVGYL